LAPFGGEAKGAAGVTDDGGVGFFGEGALGET
jgi:hypothetical protein